jgi:hypothetical protein
VTARPESWHLRAVARPARESLDGDGLALAYAALERVRAEHRLFRLSVLVDDPRLGRQVLVVPRGELPCTVDERAGWSAEPPLEEPTTDIELAVALCRIVLQVEVPTRPVDVVELALRRLEGVDAVAFDVDGDVIRVRVAGSASDTVAADALRVVKTELDHTVVVEVVRAGGAPVAAPAATAPVGDGSAVEVVAVQAAPESGELEIHLRAGDVRTVGRAALTRGLVGAAEATLEAWHARPGAPTRRVAWARTVETSADARFVVAVALETPAAHTVAHGIGAGPNPIDAAVQATVDALSR